MSDTKDDFTKEGLIEEAIEAQKRSDSLCQTIIHPFNQPNVFTLCETVFKAGLEIEKQIRETPLLFLESDDPERYKQIMGWYNHLIRIMFSAFTPREYLPLIIEYQVQKARERVNDSSHTTVTDEKEGNK